MAPSTWWTDQTDKKQSEESNQNDKNWNLIWLRGKNSEMEGRRPSSVANSFIHPFNNTCQALPCSGAKSCRCSGEEERQCLSSCGAYLPEESQIQRQENIHESIGWQAREWLGGYFSWVVSKGLIWVLTSRMRCEWWKETSYSRIMGNSIPGTSAISKTLFELFS